MRVRENGLRVWKKDHASIRWQNTGTIWEHLIVRLELRITYLMFWNLNKISRIMRECNLDLLNKTWVREHYMRAREHEMRACEHGMRAVDRKIRAPNNWLNILKINQNVKQNASTESRFIENLDLLPWDCEMRACEHYMRACEHDMRVRVLDMKVFDHKIRASNNVLNIL